jgi:hypothetical protein
MKGFLFFYPYSSIWFLVLQVNKLELKQADYLSHRQ